MDKILIVDDEQLAHISPIFEGKGYEVIGFDTKSDAIDAIQDSTPFDVAIVDMKLSPLKEDEGLEVIKKLRLKDIFTQIIVLTSYGDLKNVSEAMKYGLWQYLDKNMRDANVNELLLQEVKKALEHKKRMVERYFGKPAEKDIPKGLRYRRSTETERELLEGLRKFGVPERMVTEKQVEDALKQQQKEEGSLEEILLKMGVEEGCINHILSKQLNIDYIYLMTPDQIDSEAVQSLQEELLRVNCMIPIAKRNNHLILLMADPKDSQAIERIKDITGCEVEVFLGSPKNIMEMISKVFGEIDKKASLSKFPVEVQ